MRIVEVVMVDLDRPEGDPATLDATERERAATLAFDVDRRRYVAAHLALRRVLGVRTGRPPSTLRFRAGPHGKPALHGIDDPPAFSLSHSGAVGLVAVADGPVPIGVDVEAVRPVERSLADLFAARERARLDALDDADFTRAFFRLWTLKEAVLKALGTGLSRPLDTFAVDLDPAPRLVDPAMTGWCLGELAVPEGYAAALASPAPFAVRTAGSATTTR